MTVIGPYGVLGGTVITRDDDEALVTSALTPLILTTFCAAVALKFVPLIVTLLPARPDDGVNDVIVGAAPGDTRFSTTLSSCAV